MIVYGWGHSYNKRDWTNHWGPCESCGNVGNLKNYSSTKFFSIYFVPIIPHGNQRVIDECPACKKGRILPLSRWKELRKTKLKPALAAFYGAPTDPALAETALGLASDLGNEEEFLAVAEDVARNHGDDAKLMGRLGWAMGAFGRIEEAKSALQRSLQLEEDEDVREALDFLKEQEPVPPPPPPGLVSRFGMMMIVPAILLLLLISLTVRAFNAKPRHVYLVNGLDVPYSVLVNDKPLLLPARGRKQVFVDYGPLSVRPGPESAVATDPVEARLEASFFSRASDSLVFIINPDRTAVMSRYEVIYGKAADPKDAGENRLLVGKQFYTFDDVDYAFVAPPDSISLSSRSSSVTRVGLRQFDRGTHFDFIDFVRRQLGKKFAADYCSNLLTLRPDIDGLLSFASSLLEPERLLKIIVPKLAHRPVMVDWHRTYQELMSTKDPNRDLVAEYKKLLAADPENRSLLYLVARLLDDPDESRKLFQTATEGEDPEPFAFYALAFDLAARCEFEKALVAIRHATELVSGNEIFNAFEYEMLVANHKWTTIVERSRQALKGMPESSKWEVRLLAALSAAKQPQVAEQAKKRYLDTMRNAGGQAVSEAQIARMEAFLTAVQTQWSGTVEEFVKVAEDLDMPSWQLHCALAKQELIRATRLVEQESSLSPGPIFHLGVYAIAKTQDNESLAEQQLATALEQLRKMGKRAKGLARWFADGAKAPTLRETWRFPAMPSQRKILLAALAHRHPSHKKEFLSDSEKLNYQHDAWYFPIQDLTRSKK